ncbi:MAG: hypothetical protein NTW21_25200 [Verrucomicrobia bacterium]|nr:hypothetical protein [Verrucomicrobiota bacterium]
MPPPISNTGLRDNHTRGTVADFLRAKIHSGSKLSIVSAYFTICYKTLYHIFEKFLGDVGIPDADLGKTSLFETGVWKALFIKFLPVSFLIFSFQQFSSCITKH